MDSSHANIEPLSVTSTCMVIRSPSRVMLGVVTAISLPSNGDADYLIRYHEEYQVEAAPSQARTLGLIAGRLDYLIG